MTRRNIARSLGALSVLGLAVGVPGVSTRAQAPGADLLGQQVDAIFAAWNGGTPGCAVGVSSGGRIVLQKAYGMSDWEHDVSLTADAVFGIASVAKQFTAAAVLLLARDGRLSLDDPVRKYIPELPDYGKPLLIRHLLTHTSGLREWRMVEEIGGWPHRSRGYTFQTIVDIVARQRALNFEPGTRHCYTNGNYNLAAIIVARVSGQSLAEFCQSRIFQPLGMTRTSWREDYRRLVKGRATGYVRLSSGYRLGDPPVGAIYGDAGLDTTVADLLRWNENFFTPKVGDKEFLRIEQEPGRFNDGRQHRYALGLIVAQYKGRREILHAGAGGGYVSYLSRFPDEHLSVAVLCNASDAKPAVYAHEVADVYLASAVKANPAATATAGPSIAVTDGMKSRAGIYRSTLTGAPLKIQYDIGQFRIDIDGESAPLRPRSETTFEFGPGQRVSTCEFTMKGDLRVIDPSLTSQLYTRVEPAKPTTAELRSLAGVYTSDEAEATLRVAFESGELVLHRPDARSALHPLYKDAFSADDLVNAAGAPRRVVIVFRRDPSGRVTALSVVATQLEASLWDLRFRRRNSLPRMTRERSR